MSFATLTPYQQRKQEELNQQQVQCQSSGGSMSLTILFYSFTFNRKVRALLRLPANKKCFDCPTKSPFFVNISVQTFVCSRCSGLVREVGHRVKSISASTFSGQEVVSLQQGGNEVARSIWLSNYRMDNTEPETDNDVRAFIRQKYYEHKWLDRDRLHAHTQQVRATIKEMFTEEGIRRKGARTPPLPGASSVAAVAPLPKPTRPASLQLTRSAWRPEVASPPAADPPARREPMSAREPSGSSQSGGFALPPSSVPVTPTATMDTPRRPSQPPPQQQQQQQPITPTSTIFSELAGLQPETSKSARRATYTGGILTPSTPGAPSPTMFQFPSLLQATTSSSAAPAVASPTTTATEPSDPFRLLRQQQQSPQPAKEEDDPYAALRGLTISAPARPKQQEPDIPSFHERQDSDEMSWTEFSTSTSDADFGDFASPAPPAPDLKNSNAFGDLDPIAQIKRSGYRV
ncbi:hypothetical protein BJV82DRAFT_671925 [Fennellomyces sp. T-0311]|nr:hypothetical protein BJV82DRAFT_671925 [Fennellomyces sp. T-0311]